VGLSDKEREQPGQSHDDTRMKLNPIELGLYVHSRHQDLVEKRQPWDSWWQELGDYVMPRSRDITGKQSLPERNIILFDSTAVQANMILANGSLDSMTPHGSRWFTFDPMAQLKGVDIIEQWYKKCSEIAALEMARGNFYSIIHQVYLDRGGFGTAAFQVEPGRRELLNFSKFPIGTYAIAEDDEGHVDTLTREFEITARQAIQWFGRESLSSEILKAFDDPTGKMREKEFAFIHQLFPRAADEVEYGKRDGENKPFASVYIEKKDKKVVRVSGYEEQPFFVSRYLPWDCKPGAVYGWCPAAVALPDARQLNFLQKQLDSLAEVTAFPRFLIPDTHKDEVDLRAGGATTFDSSNPNAKPSEWLTGGKYDVGLDRVEQKRKAIREVFHVDLFRMFAEGQLDKQMTAREIAERAGEKLAQFSPTFATFTNEALNPVLRRVFKLILRAGMFPPPPRQLIQQDQTGVYIPEPEVTYSSRIALAIKSLENASLGRVFEMWSPIAEVKPEILDNWNFDRMARDTSRNTGLPADWLMDEEQMKEIRESRAKQQAEMEKMQSMAMMADAAGKVGGVKQDSLVGSALSGAMGGQQQKGKTK